MKTGHREVMQMALDALEQITPDWRTSTETLTQLNDAIEALEAALVAQLPIQFDASAWELVTRSMRTQEEVAFLKKIPPGLKAQDLLE